MRPVVWLVMWGAVSHSALAAQQWVPPREPCNIAPGHFRINSAVVNLKVAAERPEQRDRMLRQAQDVLIRSLTQDQQTANPAAWYYLGRYYVEMKDGAGADSALDKAEALAPQCRADIAGYRARAWNDVMGEGYRMWQEGKEDSALATMRQAYGLIPSNPKSLMQIAALFTNRNQPDSAGWYFEKAAEVAGADTAFAKERQDALGSVVRIHVRRAYETPAMEPWRRVRYSRDSLERTLANDSTVLARIVASSQARRSRGGRLSPADQQRFSRDSTARAEAVARGRQGRAALAQRAATDSAALAAALDPAVQSLRDYLRAYPDAVEHATTLAGLYGQLGRGRDAAAVFDSVLARSGDRLEAAPLLDAGQRLVQANLFAAGIRALSVGLAKNPSHRDGLYTLANAYVATRDTARAVAAARRVVAVDPLNRLSVRLLAGAFELAGQSDSTLKYVQLADSILPVDVVVASFVTDSAGATLTALVSNYHETPAPARPLRLVFEFLDSRGAPVASLPVDVPALAPQANQQFTLEPKGRGIVAWRYRPGS